MVESLPDECARRIDGFGVVLAIAHDWPGPAVWDRSMTLLAEEVMPKPVDLTGQAA